MMKNDRNQVPQNGVSAYGLTDDQGNYVLTTGGAPFGTGAVPGKYHVTMSKVTNNEPQLTLEEYNTQAASGKPRGDKTSNSVTHQIPEKYSQPETSRFEPVDVQNKGSNVFDFRLVSTHESNNIIRALRIRHPDYVSGIILFVLTSDFVLCIVAGSR
jgi:hypothetical protein